MCQWNIYKIVCALCYISIAAQGFVLTMPRTRSKSTSNTPSKQNNSKRGSSPPTTMKRGASPPAATTEDTVISPSPQNGKSVTLEESSSFPRASPMNTRSKKVRHKRNRSINRLPSNIEPETKKPTVGEPLASRTRSHTTGHPTYSIRPMQLKDVAKVFHLGNEIFTASEFPNMYRTWDDFAVADNYEGSAEYCFIAEDEEQEMIGFLLGQAVTKANVGTRGYIQWVAILPSYRRLGIATELIDKFIKVANEQNISLLLADTPADNEPAINMFQKAGLSHKADHVYLTRQLGTVDIKHVDDEDLSFHFSYTAKTKKRVTIRNMEIDDLEPIYKIGEQIFTQKSANLYNFWDESLVLCSYLSDPEFCVVATVQDPVTSEETVVGFAFGETIEKPKSSWKYGYLVWLGCSPEYQGIGLAYQLYNTMMELFAIEKVRMVMIDTQQNNEGALKFFRKLGFGHDEEHVYLCNASMTENDNTKK